VTAPLPGGVFVGPDVPRGWLARHRSRTPAGEAAHLRSRAGRLRTVSRRAPKTAFVFAGGGARGAAQVGMVRALLEHGIVPDAVYGSSVGAINGGGFAGDPTPAGVERSADLWRRTTRDNVFPPGRIPGPWRFFQQREAVHPNQALRRLIEDGITFERFEDAKIPFEVVATSLTDGRPRWFDRGPVSNAILASTALPALLPPVRIGDESFIDGGVVDNVPIGRAMEHGAERIFVLLCGPLHYTPHRARRPVEAVLTGFFIAIHARFARELAALPPGVEVIVFTVDTEPVSRYDDFSGTHALLEAGHANAQRVLRFWSAGGIGDGVEEAAGMEEAAAGMEEAAAGMEEAARADGPRGPAGPDGIDGEHGRGDRDTDATDGTEAAETIDGADGTETTAGSGAARRINAALIANRPWARRSPVDGSASEDVG
jgi:NTE family protein